MKFLSDEHIDLPAVEALKQIGIDIVSVQELGLRGRSDTDFLKLHSNGISHSGLVFVTRTLPISRLINHPLS